MQQKLNRNNDDSSNNHGIFELETSARIDGILYKCFLDLANAMDLERLHLKAQRYPSQQSLNGSISPASMPGENELDFESRHWTIRLQHSLPQWMDVRLSPTSQINSTFRTSSLTSVRHELNFIRTGKGQTLEKSTRSITSPALTRH